MPKNRKTRKQKIRSDEKKPVVKTTAVIEKAAPSSPHTFTFTPGTISSSGAKSIEVTSYHYLVKDLRKTLLLTLFFIVMEFVLSLFMR